MLRTSSIVLIAGLMVTTPLTAQRERISTANIALAATATTLLLLDRGMTEHGLRNGRGEWNPVIGPRPSVGRLNTYITIVGISELGVGLLLNKAEARNFWWGAVALCESLAIASSISLRIPVRF